MQKLEQDLQAEADELLWGRGLHSLLSKYGQVQVTGSYSLRLMTWRALDLYLVTNGIAVADFFSLGAQIADLLDPIRMSFRNELKARTEGLPKGLYWGIYLGDERAGAWKIDLWAMDSEQLTVLDEGQKGIERKLTESSRMRILEIKAQCWMKPGYRRTFSSLDIYTAVLDEQV